MQSESIFNKTRQRQLDKTWGNLHSNRVYTYRDRDCANKDEINITYTESDNLYSVASDWSNKYSSLNQVNLLSKLNDASAGLAQQCQPLRLNLKIPNTERTTPCQPAFRYIYFYKVNYLFCLSNNSRKTRNHNQIYRIKSLEPNNNAHETRLSNQSKNHKMKNVKQIKEKKSRSRSKKRFRSSSNRRENKIVSKLKIAKKKVYQMTNKNSKIRSISPYSSSRKSSKVK